MVKLHVCCMDNRELEPRKQIPAYLMVIDVAISQSHMENRIFRSR